VTRLLIVATLLALCGCPLSIEPADTAEGQGSLVGRPCTSDTDCEVGGCLTSQPGGYCSMPCLGGQPCPEGSRCVPVSFFGLKQASCWRTCTSHEDCGRAGYACMVPPDNGSTVCSGATAQP
jgi:hypothetical protein